MNPPATFSDPAVEAEFNRRGYVILPYLRRDVIPPILAGLQQLCPSDNFQGMQQSGLMRQSFHVTFFDPHVEYRLQVLAKTRDLFRSFVAAHLSNHRIVQGNIFLKPPGKGYVYPHQNLTITDERAFRSVSLWCPLQDTSRENGTLCVIPGSQTGFMSYRNTNVVHEVFRSFLPEQRAERFLRPLEVKAGEVVVLDDRLVHVSPINQTGNPRWVLHALYVPMAAPLRYFDVQGEQVRAYAVDDEFWQLHVPGTHPTGLAEIDVLPYDEPAYDEDSLLMKLEDLKARFE
jgi:hypothetical protein